MPDEQSGSTSNPKIFDSFSGLFGSFLEFIMYKKAADKISGPIAYFQCARRRKTFSFIERYERPEADYVGRTAGMRRERNAFNGMFNQINERRKMTTISTRTTCLPRLRRPNMVWLHKQERNIVMHCACAAIGCSASGLTFIQNVFFYHSSLSLRGIQSKWKFHSAMAASVCACKYKCLTYKFSSFFH